MKQPQTGRAWQRWTDEEAREALDELARTGESPETFARRKGISAQRLRYWKKQLANRASVTPPAFVALTLPEPSRPRRQVEVRIDEIVVAVPEGFDAEQIAALVDAIARRRRAC